MKSIFTVLQKMGKALMLPIAVLPIAGILMRIGQSDILNNTFIAGCGGIVFENLPLLFAVGVAVGLSFDSSGAAGISGLVSYLIFTKGISIINQDINMGVLSGIITGILSSSLYNKFYNIKMPEFISFFGGKRFVPIVSGISSMFLAIIFGSFWINIQNQINLFGEFLTSIGAIGAGIFGFLNSLLLPFGLHHVLNSLFWFVFGTFTDANGVVVNGDLFRFFAGDKTAGVYMAGFYPIFMFGIPAAALAMYNQARPENKKLVGGLFFSTALTFLITGIGEPFYFMFIFVAPQLYIIHAFLQGSSLAIAQVLGIKHGFTFSASLIDYILNFGIATKPLLLLIMGLGYFIIYYALFTFMIKKFNIMTPGREEIIDTNIDYNIFDNEYIERMIEYLGGDKNLKSVEACITRLRLVVENVENIDEEKIKLLGAMGIVKVGNNVQVIVGTKAEEIATKINKILK